MTTREQVLEAARRRWPDCDYWVGPCTPRINASLSVYNPDDNGPFAVLVAPTLDALLAEIEGR